MNFEKIILDLSLNQHIKNNISNSIFIELLNKNKDYCNYLENKYHSGCKLKKNDILSIIYYFEILDYLNDKTLDLTLNKGDNEANFYLIYLEITSDCFYKIFYLLDEYNNSYDNSIKDKLIDLKKKYTEELNPLNILDNEDINTLLREKNELIINKLKSRYKQLIYKYIDNLLEEL